MNEILRKNRNGGDSGLPLKVELLASQGAVSPKQNREVSHANCKRLLVSETHLSRHLISSQSFLQTPSQIKLLPIRVLLPFQLLP